MYSRRQLLDRATAARPLISGIFFSAGLNLAKIQFREGSLVWDLSRGEQQLKLVESAHLVFDKY